MNNVKSGETKAETKGLIDDAEAAANLKTQADEALATSQQTANDAAATLAERNQAVYDDLVANGSALYIETGESGDTYCHCHPRSSG